MSRSTNIRGYYATTAPNSAWVGNKNQYMGYHPEIYSNYGTSTLPGKLYPFDKPYTNNCTKLAGCFRADPVTKKGPRVCGYSCDNPLQYDTLYYLRGPAWNRSRS